MEQNHPKGSGIRGCNHCDATNDQSRHNVRRGPDRIGLLGKPPASSAFLPSRASSRTCLPMFPTHQRRYEAIRVWS